MLSGGIILTIFFCQHSKIAGFEAPGSILNLHCPSILFHRLRGGYGCDLPSLKVITMCQQDANVGFGQPNLRFDQPNSLNVSFAASDISSVNSEASVNIRVATMKAPHDDDHDGCCKSNPNCRLSVSFCRTQYHLWHPQRSFPLSVFPSDILRTIKIVIIVPKPAITNCLSKTNTILLHSQQHKNQTHLLHNHPLAVPSAPQAVPTPAEVQTKHTAHPRPGHHCNLHM